MIVEGYHIFLFLDTTDKRREREREKEKNITVVRFFLIGRDEYISKLEFSRSIKNNKQKNIRPSKRFDFRTNKFGDENHLCFAYINIHIVDSNIFLCLRTTFPVCHQMNQYSDEIKLNICDTTKFFFCFVLRLHLNS